MNWKKFFSVVLIFGCYIRIYCLYNDYRSGEVASWPLGAEIGFVLIITLAVIVA